MTPGKPPAVTLTAVFPFMTSSTVRGYLVWLTCLSVPRSHCRLCRTRGCRHPPTDTVLIPGILWHQTPLREVQEKDQTTRTRKWPIDKELAKLALNATLIPLLQEGMYVVSHVLWGLICKCNVSCLGWGPTSPPAASVSSALASSCRLVLQVLAAFSLLSVCF